MPGSDGFLDLPPRSAKPRSQGVTHVLHRQAVRIQLLDVDDDVNLAGAATGEADFADAVDRLNDPRDLFVGELGERAQAHRV